jgi:hypothetical protein
MDERVKRACAERDELMDRLAEVERRDGGGSQEQGELQARLAKVLSELAKLNDQ